MRSLIISIAILILMLGAWSIFMHYEDKSIHETARILKEDTLPAVLAEDWASADEAFAKAVDLWSSSKISYILFSNSRRVEETELTFHRLQGALMSRDRASACQEAAVLRRQLLFLHEYEIISIENII